MKRGLKIVGLLLAVLVLVPVGFLVATFAGNPELKDGLEPASGVRLVKDGYVALFMLEAGAGQVALIDAGNDPEGKVILAELKRRGLTPDAVKTIFLTHGHPDHTAACALFPQAQVLALAEDAPLAEGKVRGKSPVARVAPMPERHVTVNHLLKDGETVQVGNLQVRVFALPGHTPGSAAYLAHGVLFFGDSADARKDGTLAPAKFIFSDDTEQNRASLVALAARLGPEAGQVKALAFAHTGTLPGFGPLQAFANAR
jgi:glyoxylase-like metal-dependent hydrolase (beta-lactamase superfamily II)